MNIESNESASLTGTLHQHIARAITTADGWLGFDHFMHLALYTPTLGYYASHAPKFGAMPHSGSDFVTAPELSPVFGRVLASQVHEAMQATGVDEVWEFGAGSGALALQLLCMLDALDAQGNPGARVRRYSIVDVSSSLRALQQAVLAGFGERVRWVDRLPNVMQGVVIGNEVLDAMPVKLLHRQQGRWHERGVALQGTDFVWQDRPTTLRPPVEVAGEHDYLTEIHPQAEGFIRTLAAHLQRGAAFLVDYGFGEREYYHPQRHMGTVVCHRAHQVDANPLADVGHKDITAHVNFTAVALAAQEAGLHVLGYTTQGRFLVNCGLQKHLQSLPLPERVQASKLMMEHEMGELFKVLAVGAGPSWMPRGFAQGDCTHRL